MLNRPVDLTACDTEPIHEIGAIQPLGALVAVDAATARIEFASANCGFFLGHPAGKLLGQPLSVLLGDRQSDGLLAGDLAPSLPELLRPRALDVARPGGETAALDCFPHAHDGRVILEFVPQEKGPAALWEDDRIRQRIISDLIRPETLHELARVSAEILREVTGFDRVMIYRFAPDRHGEVIAESTVRPDSFLGLHYPASDIPDPARRHFALNLIRSIPDVRAVPVPILAAGGQPSDWSATAPLDLTFSKLRAVAPVHVEYLGNMGVGASLSISLISNHALWGLVACHHYGPLHLSWSRMRFCELIGGTISALLQSLENTVQLSHSISAEKLAFGMERAARAGRPLAAVVEDHADALMSQIGASGMALKLGAVRQDRGLVPSVAPDFASLRATMVDGIATADQLTGLHGSLGLVAGAAMLELSDDGEDWLVLFRPEFEETIAWAGKPEKRESRQRDGSLRLSPRGSFALWREERRGRSKPFTGIDDEILRILRRVLFAVNSLDRERAAVAAKALAEAEEARLRLVLLNSARQRSLGELASAVAHELNQPLSAVTNYINACRQELKNHQIALPAPIMRLLHNAVAESARAADLVRRLRDLIGRGAVALEPSDLGAILRRGVDLALAASPEPRPAVTYAVQPDMPRIAVDPVQITQVILNLVSNSLAAMQGSARRELRITAAMRGSEVEVAVSDSGEGVPPAIAATLFEPFHNSTTGGMGIGLSLCRSIVEAHGGRIGFQPTTGGAHVVFTLSTKGRRDG